MQSSNYILQDPSVKKWDPKDTVPFFKSLKELEDNLYTYSLTNLKWSIDILIDLFLAEKHKKSAVIESLRSWRDAQQQDDLQSCVSALRYEFISNEWVNLVSKNKKVTSEFVFQFSTIETMKHMFIRSNQGLVFHFLNRLLKKGYYRNYDAADLFQDGMIGLMIAVKKFDHTTGNQFSTYANWWIHHCLRRSFETKGSLICLSHYHREQIYTAKKLISNYVKVHGTQPSLPWLAKQMKCSEKMVKEILSPWLILSFDEPVNEQQNSLTRYDIFFDENAQSPEDHCNSVEFMEKISNAFNSLSPREIGIMSNLFGLEDGIPQTLDSVGQEVGLTRERIRQIKEAALTKLRNKIQMDNPFV